MFYQRILLYTNLYSAQNLQVFFCINTIFPRVFIDFAEFEDLIGEPS
jgi:hypothetical protein